MVEGSGRVKAEGIIVGRGTVETQPEYIPRTKIDVIVKDDQVEQLLSVLTNRLGTELGGKIFVFGYLHCCNPNSRNPCFSNLCLRIVTISNSSLTLQHFVSFFFPEASMSDLNILQTFALDIIKSGRKIQLF